MKGTLFSSDFVTDKDGNLRLIEVNTDTGIVEPQKYIFDWSGFIGVLNSNSITEIDCVYKYDLHHDMVNHLSESLQVSGSTVTTFTHTVVADNSIFPTSPTDADNKFILRFAYDESAILDSEYAKDGVKLLTMFVDNNDSNSVCNFYHSSSEFGQYDTLDKSYVNENNLPDLTAKTPVESHSALTFYKITGDGNASTEDTYNTFLQNHAGNEGAVISQYHISQDMIDAGTVSSVRSFDIVYGTNLDLVSVAQYNIASVFDLPETITIASNDRVDSKHYYEFATNTVKNKSHGILENEGILDVNGNAVSASDLVIGNSYQSYFISGSPNTDDYEVLRQWSYTGTTLPSGSYLTSSVLLASYQDTTFANDMTEIIFADSSSVIIGGEARMLVHDHRTDVASYQRVTDLTTDYAVFGMNGTCNEIREINLVIFDEQQPTYTYNFEDVDNYILESGNFVSFFVVHNLMGGSCFPAGTKVTTQDGDKNIEDVQIGDYVLSFNEETKETEYKKVEGSKQPIHNDLVKYKFSDGTTLVSTFDHPLYVNGLDLASFIPQWTNSRYEIGREVGKIKIGDIVRLDNGSNSAISEIQVLSPIDTQTYIITVEGNHNFYANGILVHNK